MTSPLLAQARSLPKVLLHEHLDGGLRVGTLLELLRERGLACPAPDEARLSAWFEDRAHAGSLEEYLRGFALTVAAMASPQALERVAYEAAEDARLDGCVLAEFRIAPLLFEPFGVSADVAVEALLAGLSRSALPSGLIVCAMRHHPDEDIARSADLALRWTAQARAAGERAAVVGFDLAGPEAGWPATRHAGLLRRVQEAGLGLTLHAGEADAGVRVLEAMRLGATRVGHGVRLVDLLPGASPAGPKGVDGASPQEQDAQDAQDAVWAEVLASGVHLEVCPTSNVQTGAAPSIAQHPIGALWRAGIPLSFHTDNRLISCVSHSQEAAGLIQEAQFSWQDLVRMGEMAAQASFLGVEARRAALQALLAWQAPNSSSF